MAERLNKPRGTSDLLFDDERLFQTIVNHLDSTANQFGARKCDVPSFEETRLFLRSVGESSDIVNKEMFRLDVKGEHDYVLRPEFTAGINRAVIENKLFANPDLPLKISYCGSVFRFERPQAGRLREFHQWGVEFFDAKIDFQTMMDCLLLIYRAGEELLGHQLELRINFLGSFESRENYKKGLIEFYQDKVEGMCEDCKRRFNTNVLRILDCKVDQDIEINKNAPLLQDYLNQEDRDTFDKISSLLDQLNISYIIDQRLVRGLDYYTGLVFELYDPQNRQLGAIGAGGQYGSLMKELGGPEDEGIGFSFGVERLLLALDEKRRSELLDESFKTLDYFLIDLRKEKNTIPFLVADQLRKVQKSVSNASYSKALNGSLKMADRLHAQNVLIFDDFNPGKVIVKDMMTRNQEIIEASDADNIVSALLEREKEN